MCNKIDDRVPNTVGEGVLDNHAGIKTAWGKLISFEEVLEYIQRYNAIIGAQILNAYRILVPDYTERVKMICEDTYSRYIQTFTHVPGMIEKDRRDLNMHPFMCGNFICGNIGERGDESMLMCGRVNDFGSYRVEKELDTCPWDIEGSEICRGTTISLQGCADCDATYTKMGPHLDIHMVEARGCGDRHCRIVAESREKYPMPPHEIWECFGPIATEEMIKYTEEENCLEKIRMLRKNSDYRMISGTNAELDWSYVHKMCRSVHGYSYTLPAIAAHIKRGDFTEEQALQALRRVCEAGGKTLFMEKFSREGCRHFLGAPHSVSEDDGRLAGAYIEVFLQGMKAPYTIEAFNRAECIYDIDAIALIQNPAWHTHLLECYKSFWFGMTKSLVNAQWSCWEENSTEGRLRIKIAKKIDKFC